MQVLKFKNHFENNSRVLEAILHELVEGDML